MKPEIQSYLEEHGARYTPEALRQALLDGGFEPAEVEAALREWDARAVQAGVRTDDRRRLWVFTVGVHVAVLLAIGALSLAIGSWAELGGLAIGILAVVLAVGVGLSGAVGRAALRRNTLMIAMVVPVVSALLIGGSCLAFGGSVLFQRPLPPPTFGTLELRIQPPIDFQGSGVAMCQIYRDRLGFSASAEDVGVLHGGRVSVSIDASGPSDGASPPPSAQWQEYSLLINSVPLEEGAEPLEYTTTPDSRVELRAAPDGRSGTLDFRGLQPLRGGAPAPGFEPISGTITWRCSETLAL
jgi:hypothetical protein